MSEVNLQETSCQMVDLFSMFARGLLFGSVHLGITCPTQKENTMSQ